MQDVDPQEIAMFNKFLPSETLILEDSPADPDGGGGGTNLADMILEKIVAQEALRERPPVVVSEDVNENNLDIHPKVIQVYTTYAYRHRE